MVGSPKCNSAASTVAANMTQLLFAGVATLREDCKAAISCCRTRGSSGSHRTWGARNKACARNAVSTSAWPPWEKFKKSGDDGSVAASSAVCVQARCFCCKAVSACAKPVAPSHGARPQSSRAKASRCVNGARCAPGCASTGIRRRNSRRARFSSTGVAILSSTVTQ